MAFITNIVGTGIPVTGIYVNGEPSGISNTGTKIVTPTGGPSVFGTMFPMNEPIATTIVSGTDGVDGAIPGGVFNSGTNFIVVANSEGIGGDTGINPMQGGGSNCANTTTTQAGPGDVSTLNTAIRAGQWDFYSAKYSGVEDRTQRPYNKQFLGTWTEGGSTPWCGSEIYESGDLFYHQDRNLGEVVSYYYIATTGSSGSSKYTTDPVDCVVEDCCAWDEWLDDNNQRFDDQTALWGTWLRNMGPVRGIDAGANPFTLWDISNSDYVTTPKVSGTDTACNTNQNDAGSIVVHMGGTSPVQTGYGPRNNW